ncbi:MAG: hypothetical protein LBL24_07780, partial [Bacteroidales bacterium]|nr:hypothetical protein [Bacteroidales bacterium]
KWALRTGFYLDYGFWDIRNGNKNQQLIEYNNDNPSILIHNSLLYTNQANKVNTLAAGIKLCIIIKY